MKPFKNFLAFICLVLSCYNSSGGIVVTASGCLPQPGPGGACVIASCTESLQLTIVLDNFTAAHNVLITLPTGFAEGTIISQQDCTPVFSSAGPGFVEYTVTPMSSLVTTVNFIVSIKVSCDADADQPATIMAGYVDGSNSYSDTADVQIALTTMSHVYSNPNSYIGEVADRISYIHVDSGVLTDLNFEIDVEDEIEISAITLTAQGQSPITLPFTYPLVATGAFHPLVPVHFTTTVSQGQTIEIKEHYKTVGCSVSDDPTMYRIRAVCYSSSCDGFTPSNNVTVRSPNNGLNAAFRIVPPTPGSPCNTFDVEWKITNPVDPAYPDGAVAKHMKDYIIPYDASFIHFTAVLVNGVDVTTMPAGFCDPNANPLTFDFTKLTVDVDGAGTGLEQIHHLPPDFNNPYFDALMPGNSNAMTITLVGCDLNCANMAQCSDADGNWMAFDGNQIFSYTRMCETIAQPGYPTGYIRNNFTSTEFTDAERTDLDIMGFATSFVSHCVETSGDFGPTPWSFTPVGGGAAFNCAGQTVRLEMNMPPSFSIVGNIVKLVQNGTPVTLIPQASQSAAGIAETLIYDLPAGTDPDGCIEFTVIIDYCVNGDPPIEKIDIHYVNNCDGCGCEIVFGCGKVSFLKHCSGGCGLTGTPTGTDTFNFERITFGLDEATHVPIDPANLPAGVVTDRVYPCDIIEATCVGSTNGVHWDLASPDILLFELGLDTVYDPDVDIFKCISGEFRFSPQAGCSGISPPVPAADTVPIDPADIVNTVRDGMNVIQIPFPFDVTGYYGFFDCDYSVTFVGQFVVDDPAGLNDGVYQLDMLRGQLATIIGNTFHSSCDTWGDNMNVLQTSTKGNFGVSKYRDETWGDLCTNCYKKFIFRTSSLGGRPLEDDFPAEIRYITEWPAEVSVTPSADVSFHHAYYWCEDDNSSGINMLPGQYLPVNSTVLPGGEIKINGIKTSGSYITDVCTGLEDAPSYSVAPSDLLNGWPMMDKNSLDEQWLVVVLKQDCPKSPGQFADGVFNYIDNATSEDCAIDHPNSENKSLGATNDQMTLSRVPNTWILDGYSNPLPISTFLEYTPIPEGIDNAWIYPISAQDGGGNDLITVHSITITPPGSSNDTIIYPDPVTGLFELGHLNGTGKYTVVFNVTYLCGEPDPQGVYEVKDVIIHFGFNCAGYPSIASIEDGTSPCFSNYQLMQISPMPSGLGFTSHNGVLPADGLACDPIIYEFDLFNNQEADLTSLLLDMSWGTDMTLDLSHSYTTYEGNQVPIQLPQPGETEYLLLNVLHGLTTGILHLEFTADCYDSGIESFDFDAYGTSACGLPIDVNNIPDEVEIFSVYGATTFTPTFPELACNTTGTVSLHVQGPITEQLTITCTVPNYATYANFSALPDQTDPGAPGYDVFTWIIPVATGNDIISFDITIPDEICDAFTVSFTGVYEMVTACSNACVMEASHDYEICCICEEEITFTWSATPGTECCYEFVDAYTDDISACREWTLDGTIFATGPAFSGYCFEESGSHLVCYTDCCENDEGELVPFTACEEIEVACCAAHASYAFNYDQIDICIIELVNYSTYANGTVSYLWDFGDGTTSTAVDPVHAYTGPGVYDICLTITVMRDGEICAEDTYCESVYFDCNPPCALTAVDFTAQSSLNDCRIYTFDATITGAFDEGEVCGYWEFDSVPYPYTGTHIVHTFPIEGAHTACLYLWCCDAPENVFQYCEDINVVCCHKPTNINFTISSTADCTFEVCINTPVNPNWHCAEWDFGDGTVIDWPVDSCLTHHYTCAGDYRICVKAYCCEDPGKYAMSCENIHVQCEQACCMNDADFTWHCTHDYCIEFTDLTPDGNVDSCESWVFDLLQADAAGDVHSFCFPGPGTYTVSHYDCCINPVTGQNEYHIVQHEVEVGFCCAVDPMFIRQIVGEDCLIQQFYPMNNYGFMDNICMRLDFGDGNITTDANNPIHIYSEPGFYHVCLEMWCCDDPCNVFTYCEDIDVGCPCDSPPAFTSSVQYCNVTFNATDLGMPASCLEWDFGDGHTDTAVIGQAMTHSYAHAGTYNVCLKYCCMDNEGNSYHGQTCHTVVVNCTQVSGSCDLVPLFTYEETGPCQFVFTNQSVGIGSTTVTTWHWNFGDGTTANGPTATHAYGTSGTYHVCLTAIGNNGNGGCEETFCMDVHCYCTDTNTDPCEGVKVEIKYDILEACNYQFASEVTVPVEGCPVSYFWNFGDGTYSGDANPVHHFYGQGEELVCLTVIYYCEESAQYCELTQCILVQIDCPCNCENMPEPEFTIQQLDVCTYQLVYTGNMPECFTIEDYYFTVEEIGTLSQPFIVDFPGEGIYHVCLRIWGTTEDGPCEYEICDIVYVGCESDLKKLAMPTGALDFRLVPNPTRDAVKLVANQVLDDAQIRIMDAHGHVVETRQHVSEQDQVGFDMSGHAGGIYSVQLITREGMIVKYLVVEH